MDIKQYFNHSAKSYWQNYEGDTIWAEAFRVRKALVLEMLEDKGKVIDVGCGPVIITSDLASRNNELWGVDISLEMIKLCRDSVATGCSGKGHFIVGDAKNLPFPDNFFDTAIAMGVLEYLDGRDEELTLDELLRVIKPQGHLILTLPNFLSPYRLWYRLLFSPLARWRLKIKNLFNRDYHG